MLWQGIDFSFEPLFLNKQFRLRQNELATEARKHGKNTKEIFTSVLPGQIKIHRKQHYSCFF